MATTNNNRLPVRATSDGNQLPAAPRPPGSALLSIAQALIDKSKQAGSTAVTAGGRAAAAVRGAAGKAARATGHAVKQLAPEKPVEVLIDEGPAIVSHGLTHAAHRYVAPWTVPVKGGLELIALIFAKLKKASPRTMRALRSNFRGTLHHSLGYGLHKAMPFPASEKALTTSGAEEPDVGEAEPEDDGAENTRF